MPQGVSKGEGILCLRRSYCFACFMLCLLTVGLLQGCTTGNATNPPGTTRSLLSGTITDINGSPIVGATVTFQNRTTLSSQFGTYAFENVSVPTGQTSLIASVFADLTIAGRQWSGTNMVEVIENETSTANTHIVMSPVSTQNEIRGTVRDAANRPLNGARVFAAVGPFNSNGSLVFAALSSFNTRTDANGNFILPELPPDTEYTVTASLAGFTNHSISNIVLNAPPAAPTNVALTLNTTANSPTLPAVQNFSALSITSPTVPTRSTSRYAPGVASIRRWILARKGLTRHRKAEAGKVTLKRKTTRVTPTGSLIETDLFWDYEQFNNLFGYDISLATNITPGSSNFASVALLRDPLATRFSDLDLSLTPDIIYYYSVARLDTILFPQNNANGIGSDSAIVAVQPLNAISLTAPFSGQVVSTTTPTFRWTPVNRAAFYQILVYDTFPDLQSDTDTVNGVQPIWPQNQSNPGSSLVAAPATSQVYGGPALRSGRTYYWAVLAQDTNGSAFTISSLQPFVVP